MPFAPSNMLLSSPSISHDQPIPVRHTQDGENLSPAMTWQSAPVRAKSFAIFCHDPDAPLVSPNGTYGYVHWLVYNIPKTVDELPEAFAAYTHGQTDADSIAYSGPKPPEGHGTHRYYFWLLALNVDNDLPSGLTLWDFLHQVEPYILGMSRLVGTYRRD
ncbi:MAG: YbhB/YbcL family Raf kinase inhibitor-like protein [Natronospirillum sp.]